MENTQQATFSFEQAVRRVLQQNEAGDNREHEALVRLRSSAELQQHIKNATKEAFHGVVTAKNPPAEMASMLNFFFELGYRVRREEETTPQAGA